MPIQQIIQVQIVLQGDNVTNTFTYSFNQLFGLVVSGFNLINTSTLPSSIIYIPDPDSLLPNVTPTLDGFGNLVLTFDTPFTGIGTVTLQLVYNSGTLAGTTQAWNSSTAVNSTWTLPLNGQNNIAFGVVVSGTVSAGVIGFQASQDGATWFTLQGAMSNSYTAATSWNTANGTCALEFDTAGFSYFRAILTTPITGAGTVTFIIQSSQVSLEPVPTVGQSNAALLNATIVGTGTFAVQASQSGTWTDTVVQPTAANLNATVVGTTLTKGTQGSTGFSVQELKDAGRTFVTLSATAAAGVTTEALFSFSQNKGGTVTAGVSSYTITSGKTFRIQTISVSVRAGAAAVPFSRCILRSNTAGATVASSAVVYNCGEVFGISATTGVGGQECIVFPDGFEIAGNGTVSLGMSHLDQATTNIINVTIAGYEY